MVRRVWIALLADGRRARLGAGRRADVPPAGRVGGQDRVRLRGRHLARAEGRRRRHAPQLAARRGDRSRASRPTARRLAYSADYDGNTDVYVVPTAGGEPMRLTHHPMADRVVGWHPDGKRVLFASGRESGRQRYNQFYLVGLDGGLPEKLPVPYGEFGAFSPDGARFVYMPMSQDFRNWKRYRGGWAPDLWLFDLKTFAVAQHHQQPGERRAADVVPQHHLLHLGSRRRAAQQHLGRGHRAPAPCARSRGSTTSTSRSRRSARTPSSFRRAGGSTC